MTARNSARAAAKSARKAGFANMTAAMTAALEAPSLDVGRVVHAAYDPVLPVADAAREQRIALLRNHVGEQDSPEVTAGRVAARVRPRGDVRQDRLDVRG